MIVTRIQLFCSGEGCRNFFPVEGPVDGAIYSHADLRAASRQHGWHPAYGRDSADRCPDCWAKHDKATRKARR